MTFRQGIPSMGVERILDKSLPGAFLLRTYGAEIHFKIKCSKDVALDAVRSYFIENGQVIDADALCEHAQLAGLLHTADSGMNPTVVLVNFPDDEQVFLRAYAKEGMLHQKSAQRTIEMIMKHMLTIDEE